MSYICQDINLPIQEAERNPYRNNLKKSMSSYMMVKFLKTIAKKNPQNLKAAERNAANAALLGEKQLE